MALCAQAFPFAPVLSSSSGLPPILLFSLSSSSFIIIIIIIIITVIIIAGDSWKDFNTAQVLTRRNMVVMYGNKRQLFQPNKIASLCSTCTPAFLLFRWASILRFANAAHCLCVERHIFQSHVAYSAIWSCYQHTGQTICYIAIHCIGKDVRSSLQPSLLVCLLRVHCMDLYDYSHSLCLLIVCSIK